MLRTTSLRIPWELAVQEPPIGRHLLHNPKQVRCGQCDIRERFSPSLLLTPLQQDHDRRTVAQILPPGPVLLAEHEQGLPSPKIGYGKGVAFAALAPGDGDRESVLIREAMPWRAQELEQGRIVEVLPVHLCHRPMKQHWTPPEK